MKPVRACVVVWIGWLASFSPAPAAPPADAISALLADHARKYPKAVVGLSVIDLRDSTRLAAAEESRLFTPASNQKVLTSAFALVALGGEGQFTTTAWLDGADLIVTGQFDPTLGDPVIAQETGTEVYAEMDRWAKALQAATGGKGVRRILLAARAPGRGCRHEDWPASQHHTWYAAPVSDLNFQNNCLDVSFQVSGARCQTTISPASRFFRITDQTRVGPSQTWNLRLADNDAALTLTGTVAKSTADPLHVAVNDPPLFFGRVLADRLARAGMPAPTELAIVAPGKAPGGAKAVATTVTPLSTVMARANKRSLNMAAECLLLRAGDGTWAGSAREMQAVLTKAYNLPPGSLVIRDGSGLSSQNRLTPAAMTAVLSGLAKRKDARVFLDSLPRAGVDGTLKRRIKDRNALGRIIAKTGYISNTHALSGYVVDKTGACRLAFSILVNGTNLGARDLEDRVTRTLIKWLDGK